MFFRIARVSGALVLMILGIGSSSAAEEPQRTANAAAPEQHRLSRALGFVSAALIPKILNVDLSVHWIGESDRFWITRQTPAGAEFVIVDAATAKQYGPLDQASLNEELRKQGRRAPFRRPASSPVRTARGRSFAATSIYGCATTGREANAN